MITPKIVPNNIPPAAAVPIVLFPIAPAPDATPAPAPALPPTPAPAPATRGETWKEQRRGEAVAKVQVTSP